MGEINVINLCLHINRRRSHLVHGALERQAKKPMFLKLFQQDRHFRDLNHLRSKLKKHEVLDGEVKANGSEIRCRSLNACFLCHCNKLERSSYLSLLIINIIITHADWLTECGTLRVQACCDRSSFSPSLFLPVSLWQRTRCAHPLVFTGQRERGRERELLFLFLKGMTAFSYLIFKNIMAPFHAVLGLTRQEIKPDKRASLFCLRQWQEKRFCIT